MAIDKQKRLFSFGEEWGIFYCENQGCEKTACCIELTKKEDDKLPENVGHKAAAFIMTEGIGKAVCEEHQHPNLVSSFRDSNL